MAYARMVDGAWHDAADGFVAGEGDDAIQYPAGWLDGADDEQRAALAAVAIVEEPAPAGVPITGYEIVDVAGVPHRRAIVQPLGALRAARLEQLAAIRWARQQVMTWNGAAWPSDLTTMTYVSGKTQLAERRGDAPDAVIARWKVANGAPLLELTVAQAVAYGETIDAHVQACFDHEASIAASLVAAADIAAVMAIALDAGWPA